MKGGGKSIIMKRIALISASIFIFGTSFGARVVVKGKRGEGIGSQGQAIITCAGNTGTCFEYQVKNGLANGPGDAYLYTDEKIVETWTFQGITIRQENKSGTTVTTGILEGAVRVR